MRRRCKARPTGRQATRSRLGKGRPWFQSPAEDQRGARPTPSFPALLHFAAEYVKMVMQDLSELSRFLTIVVDGPKSSRPTPHVREYLP